MKYIGKVLLSSLFLLIIGKLVCKKHRQMKNLNGCLAAGANAADSACGKTSVSV